MIDINTVTMENVPRFGELETAEIGLLASKPELLKRAMELEREYMARKTSRDGDMVVTEGRDTYTLRVSEKGAVSIYGFGRWPVTLYAEQWIKLLLIGKHIFAFIEAATKAGRITPETDEQRNARREARKAEAKKSAAA